MYEVRAGSLTVAAMSAIDAVGLFDGWIDPKMNLEIGCCVLRLLTSSTIPRHSGQEVAAHLAGLLSDAGR